MNRLLVLMAAVACAAAPEGELGSAPGPAVVSRAEERVTIPSMTIVTGIAVNDRYVFVATPNAIGVYDRIGARWLPPLARPQGWPDGVVTVFMADPTDLQGVWFAADNVVYHYRVGDEEVVRTIVPMRIVAGSMFIDGADPAAGVLLQTAPNVYLRVSAGGGIQQITAAELKARAALLKMPRSSVDTAKHIVPQSVPSVFARFRSLQDFQRVLTQDVSLRSWPLISAGAAPTQSEVWLGSGGGGVFKVDPVFARSEQMPFGLLGEGAGAVALAADGVWIGSMGAPGSPRDGITLTDASLRHWRWIDGGAPSYFTGARVTGLSQYASVLWAATDRGVLRVDVNAGDVMRVWDGGGGIPLCVAATNDGAWIGTSHTLSFVHNVAAGVRGSAVDAPAMEAGAVHALARRGDTLWIASDAGALVLAPGETRPRRLRASNTEHRLNEQVVAIATADSLVAIATGTGDVLRLNAATGDVLDAVSFVNAARVGRVTALAMDAKTIWITGDRGVLVMGRESRAQKFLSSAIELPGEALGVVLTPQFAWVAARGGVVRLARLDDGLVR